MKKISLVFGVLVFLLGCKKEQLKDHNDEVNEPTIFEEIWDSETFDFNQCDELILNSDGDTVAIAGELDYNSFFLPHPDFVINIYGKGIVNLHASGLSKQITVKSGLVDTLFFNDSTYITPYFNKEKTKLVVIEKDSTNLSLSFDLVLDLNKPNGYRITIPYLGESENEFHLTVACLGIFHYNNEKKIIKLNDMQSNFRTSIGNEKFTTHYPIEIFNQSDIPILLCI